MLPLRGWIVACLVALVLPLPIPGGDARAQPSDASAPAESAADALRSHHGALRRAQAGGGDVEARTQAVVDALIDYAWLTDAALRGKGGVRHACEPRCAELEGLLARLVRRNYLRVLGGSSDGELEILGEDRKPRATRVRTRVRWSADGRTQSVDVAYVMHVVEGRWMVRDVITDGVSLAATYRHDFHRSLEAKGIDGLVAQLQGKLAELAARE